jgi:hypothetical protein
MDIPANVPWQEPLSPNRPAYVFRRVPHPNSALTLLPLIGVLLLFPSLLSQAGGMAGIPVRSEPQVLLCNSGLAITGVALLLWSLLQWYELKSSETVKLILDEDGLGESGHADPQQDWRLPWARIQMAVLTGREQERVLRLYTVECGDRPAYLLFDYPFENIAPEIAERMAAAGKRMIVSV